MNTMADTPLWAVYAKDGTVLTTLDKAREGGYWAYKNGLADAGTYVGPYPDKDRPMLELTTVCARCDGTGHTEGVHACPCDIDDRPVLDDFGYTVDTTRTPEPAQPCYRCGGFGHVRMNGWDRFKNSSTYARAKATGKVRLCSSCKGSGRVQFLPILEDCYPCRGRGKVPTWDPTRPILPPEVSDCEDATEEFMWAWLRSVTITVQRQERGLSWGEANLGLVGMGSCVDYGRAYTGTDEVVIAEVVDRITSGGEQFIKMIDRRTRIFGPALIIAVTRNGYSILVANADVAPGLGALPPTYFPTVFEETR